MVEAEASEVEVGREFAGVVLKIVGVEVVRETASRVSSDTSITILSPLVHAHALTKLTDTLPRENFPMIDNRECPLHVVKERVVVKATQTSVRVLQGG